MKNTIIAFLSIICVASIITLIDMEDKVCVPEVKTEYVIIKDTNVPNPKFNYTPINQR